MLNRIIEFSLRNRMLVMIAGVVLLVAGTYTARKMEVDVFPDLNAPTVVVMTEASGMAAEEVERTVTFPIETAVERSDRRASRPFVLDLRLLGRMGRVRLGNRHLPGPPDRIRKAGCAERDASEQRRDADTRAAVVHPGQS